MTTYTQAERLAELLPCVTAKYGITTRCYEMRHSFGDLWYEHEWCWACRAVKSPELLAFIERECERVRRETIEECKRLADYAWCNDENAYIAIRDLLEDSK